MMTTIRFTNKDEELIQGINQLAKNHGYRLYIGAETVQQYWAKKKKVNLVLLVEGNVYQLGEELSDIFDTEISYDYARGKIALAVESTNLSIQAIQFDVASFFNRYVPLYQYLQSKLFTVDGFVLEIKDGEYPLYDPFQGYNDLKKGILKRLGLTYWNQEQLLHFVDLIHEIKLAPTKAISHEVKEFVAKEENRTIDIHQLGEWLADTKVVKKVKVMSSLGLSEYILPGLTIAKTSAQTYDIASGIMQKFVLTKEEKGFIHCMLFYYYGGKIEQLAKQVEQSMPSVLQWYITNDFRLKSCERTAELSQFQIHRLLFNQPECCLIFLMIILHHRQDELQKIINEIIL